MTSILALGAANKLPEHIRESYPALVAFIQTYYQFVDSLESIRDNLDIDTASEKYIEQQAVTFARGFNLPTSLSVKEFVRNNKAFFAAKGNEQAFIYFFKAFFGEDVTVVKPGYIIASGGKFSQDHFISIKTTYGSFTGQFVDFTVENSVGKFSFTTKKIDDLGGGNYRLYFTIPRGFNVAYLDKILHRNADTNVIEYLGTIDLSPKEIKVVNPGKYWQVGQVVTMPGTTKDTIARVTRIDTNKGIAFVEIIDFGVGHTKDQTLVTSPFLGRPAGTVYTVTKVVTAATPRAYLWTLTINDSTNGVSESVRGVVNSNTVIAVDNIYATTPVIANTDFSLQDWLDSRATLSYTFDTLAKTRAFYIDEDSLISNQSNKIHDSYYYQAFSYLLQTRQNIDTYRGAVEAIHPAGLKFFAELTKLFEGDVNAAYEISRSMSIDKLYFEDVLDTPTDDTFTRLLTKPFSDTINNTDALSNNTTKPFSDISSITDNSTSVVSGGYAAVGYDSGTFSTISTIITIT